MVAIQVYAINGLKRGTAQRRNTESHDKQKNIDPPFLRIQRQKQTIGRKNRGLHGGMRNLDFGIPDLPNCFCVTHSLEKAEP